MKADVRTDAAIKALIQEFAAGYSGFDAHRVMALYALDPAITVFVDGGNYKGQDQIRAMIESDFSNFDSITWQITPLSVSAVGPIAWIAADATATGQTGGQSVSLGAYLVTWVCEQREERWFIVHAHVSALAKDD